MPDPHHDTQIADSDDETSREQQNNEDSTERYGDAPQVDVFEELIREADERRAREENNKRETSSQRFGEAPYNASNGLLSDEQKERMLRNKRLAEEKRKKREIEKMATGQLEDILQNMLL